MDRFGLGSFRFLSASQPDPNVEEALGTQDYVFWTLRDSTYDDRPLDPRGRVHLAVTYYTGKPDPVPHTPDVCFLGSGYQIEGVVNRTVSVDVGGRSMDIPIRAVTFVKSSLLDLDELTVVYTFYCNGQFAASRNSVRRIVNHPLADHAYYSKVEISFGGGLCQPKYPSAEDSIEAAVRLLSEVLPVLLEEHWPDWAAVTGRDRSADASSADWGAVCGACDLKMKWFMGFEALIYGGADGAG